MLFHKKREISQAEMEIARKRSEIFAVCFENFPIAVTLTSLEGKILFANASFFKLLGYKREHLSDLDASDLYANLSDRKILMNELRKDRKMADFVVNLKHRNGALIRVKMNVMLLFDGKDEFLLTTAENLSRVTSLKKQLSESHKKFRFLYENSADAIMRLAPPDWKFTAGNKATLSMFGVKDEKTFASLGPWELSPEYQPDGMLSSVKAKKMIDKAVAEGSHFFEWTHKRYGGEVFAATVSLTRLMQRGEIFLQAIVRDISQQKKGEEVLSLFVEKTKKKLSDIIPVKKAMADAGDSKSDSFSSFLETINAVIDVLKDRTVELEQAQKAMVSLIEDISEEKKKAEESEKQTEAIIESSADGVFVVDDKGVVSLFNPAAEQMSGWKATEVVGKKCCDTVHFYSNETEKEPNLLIKEALSSGLVKKMGPNAILRKKNGEVLPIADCISPIKDKDGKVVGGVIVFSDASREREIDHAKSEFVTLASHQLRTPISATSWFIEMLLSGEIGQINGKQKEYLEEINYSNRRMEEMVSMLLNISRIEMGKVIIEPVSTDMEHFVDTSISHIGLVLEKKNISIEKKIQKDLSPVRADQKLLGIVLDNLLSNAVNYTLSDGHIIVSVSKNSSDFIIEVSDDGIGIPKEDQPKIFSKLFRSDNAKEIDTNGTGIGLYMIKSIIEKWNGTIRFVSPVVKKKTADGEEKEVGTSFLVTIPLSGMVKKEGTTHLI